MQALLPQLANTAVCQYDNYFDSYISLTESAHYPDAIYLACGGGTYLLLRRPLGSVTAFLSTSYDYWSGMAERQNGRMAEWRNGGIVEWQNGGMAEWRNGGMAEWRNGRVAKCTVQNSTESRYGKYTDASLAKPLSAC